jgi:hypothetical protein
MKIWSPLTCDVLFKLEDKANASTFVEVSQPVSTSNEWVELSFNFTGASSGTYDKIVIFMDFASSTDNTFYFDDIEGPEYGGGSTGDPVTLPVTFDDPNVNYALADFGGNLSEIVEDPTNASNMVAKSIKTDGAEIWAGTTIGGSAGFPEEIPFEPGETFMTVRVWSPTSDTPIRLKVEDSGDPTISVETETNTTIAEDWETLVFDFSDEAPGTAEINFDNYYNKASIFFNFGTNGADDTYYWDDVEFGPLTSISKNDIKQLSFLQNPVMDILELNTTTEVEFIKVFNMAGQSVNIKEAGLNSYDVSMLEKGIYSVLVIDKAGNYLSGKMMKQ